MSILATINVRYGCATRKTAPNDEYPRLRSKWQHWQQSFYFETNFYENQGRFAAYVDSVIRINKIIPRQARYKNIGDGLGFDFNYSNARLIYIPNQHLLFDVGYSRNFVGDGYRSMLLSDFATDHPYFKRHLPLAIFNIPLCGRNMIAEGRESSNLYAYGIRINGRQTYCLDWKATQRFTAGLFESVIWAGVNAQHRNDFGITYASPVMFLHAGKVKVRIAK